MNRRKSGEFSLTEKRVRSNGFEYVTFEVEGVLCGRRVRRQFKDREQAFGEKNALEVQAANLGGEIRAQNTRLTPTQLAECEVAVARLGANRLSLAVDWFLTTYKAPMTEMSLENASKAFLAAKTPYLRTLALRDYRVTLKAFGAAFRGRTVHSIATDDIQGFLSNRGVGKKRLNNLRGDLNAFFAFCHAAPRRWIADNPVKPIPKYRIAQGIPEIITADTAARLMNYVESYSGGPKSGHVPGFLAPYFALCLFAGLRPSIPEGEVCKLGRSGNLGRLIDLELGVIRITPDTAKTNSVRQVAIQPNLTEWLVRYPPAKYPIANKRVQRWVTAVRKKFGLGNNVLRHTFISMHVARFKSLGAAALEAGNSETMIRRHYLNLVSENEANKFWAIRPGMSLGNLSDITEQPA